jgi:hypothetical protein
LSKSDDVCFKTETGADYFESIYQRNNLSIVHHLLFNVTALPSEEYLQEAELKVWALVHCSKENLLGLSTGKKTIVNLISHFSEFLRCVLLRSK